MRLLYVREPKAADDLGPWLATIKSGAMINGQVQKLGRTCPGVDDPANAAVTTDRNGQFIFRGIGTERDACLELAASRLLIGSSTSPPAT